MRTIVLFPNKALTTRASEVEVFDEDLNLLIEDMKRVMREGSGIGLAANQVGDLRRVIVVAVNDLRVFINPVITSSKGSVTTFEGCLSLPGVRADVVRPDTIEGAAFDAEGNAITFHAEGLEAVCIQHEIDHLDGKTFLDYLGPVKRRLAMKGARK